MKLALYLSTNKISDEAFGQQIGLSQSQVNRIRRGISKPTLKMVEKISAETKGNVSFKDFVSDDEKKVASCN